MKLTLINNTTATIYIKLVQHNAKDLITGAIMELTTDKTIGANDDLEILMNATLFSVKIVSPDSAYFQSTQTQTLTHNAPYIDSVTETIGRFDTPPDPIEPPEGSTIVPSGTVTPGEVGEEEGGVLGFQMTTNNIILAMLALKVAGMPGGMQTIRAVAVQFLKGLFSTLHAGMQASAANKVAAWANPMVLSAVLYRIGLVPKSFIPKFQAGISIIAGAEVATNIMGAIAGFIPFTKPADATYPDQITFSSPTTGDRVETKGVSVEEFKQLLKATGITQE